MVRASVYWLNASLRYSEVPRIMSPSQIVTGHPPSFQQHYSVQYGTYCQVHNDGNSPMRYRTTSTLDLLPTYNEQGGMYFYSFSTGKRITGRNWTTLPIPSEIITQVHRLAHKKM